MYGFIQFQAELKNIMHELLVGSTSRSRALDFMEAMLKTNRKRNQLQVDEDCLFY